MAISFVEATKGTFFSRIGEIGNLLDLARTYYQDAGTFDAAVGDLLDELSGGDITPSGDVADERDLASFVWDSYQRNVIGGNLAFFADLRILAIRLLRRHIHRDTGQWDRDSLDPAITKRDLQELRRQMVAGSELLELSTIGNSLATTLLITGNGTPVSSYIRGDGKTAELIFAENIIVDCVKDSYAPDGIQNHEEFLAWGVQGVDGMHPDWSGTNRGSGARKLFRVVDPSANNSRGNLLVNGFESFTSSSPDGWNPTTGTATTDFTVSAAQAYFGSNSLDLIGGTGVLTTLEQSFASSVANYSTPAKLEGNTPYAVILRMKADAAPASGAAVFELVDSANSLDGADDDQGVDNTFTIDLTTLTTNWSNKTGIFRTPLNVPSSCKVRLRVTTAVPAARRVYVDSVAFAKMTEIYPGGPWMCIFAGSTPFQGNDMARDSFTLAPTNTNGGAAHARKTFHRLLDAIFNLREHGILLPTSATQTIDDTAIG